MNGNKEKDFFKDSKILDENGQPIILWHGSRSNTLKEFDFRYEGTGVVSIGECEYGGFFFTEDKEGAEYYCYDGIPEEKIDKKKGEIFITTYGNEKDGFYFNVEQRDDIAYDEKYEELKKEFFEKNGKDADIDDMEIDIDDKFENIGNGGAYTSKEEAYKNGEALVEEQNKCFEEKINPYLYPIHLTIKSPYIHDTKKDGFKTARALIKEAKDSDIDYDGIKILDIFDGDREMTVYVAFEPSQIMILDKMNPDNCGVELKTSSKKAKKAKMKM